MDDRARLYQVIEHLLEVDTRIGLRHINGEADAYVPDYLKEDIKLAIQVVYDKLEGGSSTDATSDPIAELEAVMVEYGVVMRAIPKVVKAVYGTAHIGRFPTGRVQYLPEFKREMLIVERTPRNAGKFIFEYAQNTDTTVRFRGATYYDTIGQAVDALKATCTPVNDKYVGTGRD